MTTERKIIIFGSLITILLIFGGYLIASKQDEHLTKPLKGQEVKVTGGHVPDGTKVDYNSSPPAGGQHYDTTAHAGVYNKAPADGNMVHSLEHGAVILWYKADLPKSEIEKLKQIFNQTSGKGIMTPRAGLDVPVAISSWGRVLKLKTIDEKQIKTFFETNNDRGTEQAPI